jgi:hypothetical protein
MLTFGHYIFQNAALDVQISIKNKAQFFPSERTEDPFSQM